MPVLEGRASYLRTIAQIANERAAARPAVRTLRGSRFDLWEKDIPDSWRTAGFVQELTTAASDVLEADPRESLALAQLALAVATSIPPDTYPTPILAQIEGTAWKEIGTAHRYRNEFDAALRAYDRAHRSFSSAHALSHDDAVVDFARAILLGEMGRYQDALDLLAAVEPMFRSFNDEGRIVKVAVLRGNIHMLQGQPQEAPPIYKRALVEVPEDDLHTRAMLNNNLGKAYSVLGDSNGAVVHLHEARQLFIALGMTVEVNRTEWNLAELLLLNGEFAKASPILQRVRDVFLEKGLPEDAGRAGLDLAEVLIATDRAAEARELVVTVLREFTAANLSAYALTALAYLRDELPKARQPRRAVRHVREYLDRLRDEPAHLFLPLPED